MDLDKFVYTYVANAIAMHPPHDRKYGLVCSLMKEAADLYEILETDLPALAQAYYSRRKN